MRNTQLLLDGVHEGWQLGECLWGGVEEPFAVVVAEPAEGETFGVAQGTTKGAGVDGVGEGVGVGAVEEVQGVWGGRAGGDSGWGEGEPDEGGGGGEIGVQGEEGVER